MRFLVWACCLAVIFFFSACDKEKEDIPSYIQIDSAIVVTDAATQGSASHNITDAWIYINGKNVGTFEIPALIPLLNTGKTNLQIRAGIKMSGMVGMRPEYPYYTSYFDTLDLPAYVDENSIVHITPTFRYADNTTFVLKEDFEAAGVCFEPTVASQGELTTTSVPGEVFVNTQQKEKNVYSGKVVLDEGKTFFEVLSNSSFDLPCKGSNSTFLELNYKCTHKFYVGLNIGGSQRTVILYIVPTDQWKKIYINLTPTLVNNGISTGHRLFIGASVPEDEQAVFLFDNIKLIHN